MNNNLSNLSHSSNDMLPPPPPIIMEGTSETVSSGIILELVFLNI
jgi:hypothetical protein